MKPTKASPNNNFSFQRTVAFLGIVLFVAKLIAWHLTNSDAVFSDALESIVNIIAAFMGLYSLYLAAKPVDHDHPYGHGKVEFVTSGVEGALIIFAGVMIIVQAFDSLLHGNTLEKLDAGIYIIAATAVVNYLIGYYSIKRGIKENSLVLQSSGKHLQSDTLTTGGVVVSLILVYLTGITWIDSLVALVFGGYIMWVGYKIIRKALIGIMDEADLEMISRLASNLQTVREKQWVDLHNVRIQQHGSKLHLDAHLTLPYYLSLREAHEEMETVIKTIAARTEREIEFNFHMDDCKPFSCKICALDTCPVREFDFEKQIEWTRKTITQRDKHTIET